MAAWRQPDNLSDERLATGVSDGIGVFVGCLVRVGTGGGLSLGGTGAVSLGVAVAVNSMTDGRVGAGRVEVKVGGGEAVGVDEAVGVHVGVAVGCVGVGLYVVVGVTVRLGIAVNVPITPLLPGLSAMYWRNSMIDRLVWRTSTPS